MTFRSKMLYSLSVVALFTTASIATAVLFVALGRADDADPAGKAPAKEAQPPTKVQSSNSTDEPAKPPKEAQAEIKTGNGFLHPPLECMKRFTRIDSYPIVGWCFHGKGGGGNDAEYVRTAKGAGFNVLLDAAELLTPAAEVGGVKVMPIVFRWPVDKLKSDLFARHPDSPVLLGLVLDDDCPQIYPWSINASNFLKSDYPHLVPYISENPHPKSQAKTQMPILSTQNYSIKNFGHKDYARRAYCSGMGRDRVAANKYHMTFWP
ncbi:MAG: hypothetical protein K8T25_22170, partial [Planctomycetia bacterium]|nr:hypothetical protein [Planctomycetia bacterium]